LHVLENGISGQKAASEVSRSGKVLIDAGTVSLAEVQVSLNIAQGGVGPRRRV
jgi:hypothetical protein